MKTLLLSTLVFLITLTAVGQIPKYSWKKDVYTSGKLSITVNTPPKDCEAGCQLSITVKGSKSYDASFFNDESYIRNDGVYVYDGHTLENDIVFTIVITKKQIIIYDKNNVKKSEVFDRN